MSGSVKLIAALTIAMVTIYSAKTASANEVPADEPELNRTREGREYSYPGDYEFNAAYQPGEKWAAYPPIMHHPNNYPDDYVSGNCVGPVMNSISALGLKALLGAIIGVAIVKLPLILLIKGLLLKIAIPLGLLWAVGVVLLPLIYVLLPRLVPLPPPVVVPAPDIEGRSAGSESSQAALISLLEAPGCIEAIACNVGRSQTNSSYNKQIQWALKTVGKIFGRDPRIELYRTSYLEGTAGAACPVCPTKLVLQQGSRSFTIL